MKAAFGLAVLLVAVVCLFSNADVAEAQVVAYSPYSYYGYGIPYSYGYYGYYGPYGYPYAAYHLLKK